MELVISNVSLFLIWVWTIPNRESELFLLRLRQGLPCLTFLSNTFVKTIFGSEQISCLERRLVSKKSKITPEFTLRERTNSDQMSSRRCFAVISRRTFTSRHSFTPTFPLFRQKSERPADALSLIWYRFRTVQFERVENIVSQRSVTTWPTQRATRATVFTSLALKC